MAQYTIGTLNIGAASKDRARRLLDEWIIPSSYDVYVFTETSQGQGTNLIISEFKAAGWAVFQRTSLPKDQDRGAAIATRIRATASTRYPANDPAPGRSIVIDLHTSPGVQVIGMYVPNRGKDPRKTERKRTFLGCWLKYLTDETATATQRILVGDLNVVPTTQRPFFLPQQQFEYDWYEKLDRVAGLYDAALRHGNSHESTWVAHTGEGYTYDHIMLQKNLVDRIVKFEYDHSTRLSRDLTDHSALVLTIDLDSVQRLKGNPVGRPEQIELF